MNHLTDILKSIKSKSEYVKDVEVLGVVFGIGILTVDEEIKSNIVDSSFDDEEGRAVIQLMKKNMLSYAIKKLGDVVLQEEIVDTVDGVETRIQKPVFLKSTLDSWGTPLVDNLFEVYLDIKEEHETNLKKSLKFNWYRTPEAREEQFTKKMEEYKKIAEGAPLSKEKPLKTSEDVAEETEKENPIEFKRIQ